MARLWPARPLTGTLLGNTNGSSQALAFYDDGNNGDTTANDGIFTTNFLAPAPTGFYPAATDPHYIIKINTQSGPSTRQALAEFAVNPATARIAAGPQISVTDTNSNTLYDVLTITVPVFITHTGQFRLEGTLIDPNGIAIQSAVNSSWENNAPWPAGLQKIPLAFDGKTIRQHNVSGSYVLTNVVLYDDSATSIQIDAASKYANTPPYLANQFEANPTVPGTSSELATDTNGNGKFDALQFNIKFDGVSEGAYMWGGHLVDANDNDIGWTQQIAYVDGLHPFTFIYSGTLIGTSGLDGPYHLRDVTLAQLSGDGSRSSAYFSEVSVTRSYAAKQFEGEPKRKVFLPLIQR